ncbi:MAG: glycosyltransferase family 39 protein [Myxococcota bacterium]|nr:glycosyltransferase family 39 protein [Myxococcota bacterium]
MEARRVALLALGGLALFLVGSASIGVVDRDEARFALAVREMAERGDWIVPTNWDELRFQKPILVYWLAGASWSALGETPFGLRLPSALSSLAVVLLSAFAFARRFGPDVGFRAGVILATSVMLVIEAHAFTADAALLLGTTVSFLAWEKLREGTERPGWVQLLFWLAVAWGALAKLVNVGFLIAAAVALELVRGRRSDSETRTLLALCGVGALAVAIPGFGSVGVVVMIALAGTAALRAWQRSERLEPSLGIVWGAPLAVAIFAAWGVPAVLETEGAFFTKGVQEDMLGRTTRGFEGHWGIPGYYVATTLLIFAPWGALLPAAVVRAFRKRNRDRRLLLPVAWIVGCFVMLELVTSKLPHYMLVTFPALALVVALELRFREDSEEPIPIRLRHAEALVGALLPAALAIGSIVLAVAIEDTAVRAVAIGYALLALGVAGVMVRVLRGGTPARIFRRLAAGAVVLYLGAFGALFPTLERVRIAGPLAEAVARHLRPGETLLLHDFQPASVGYALPVRPELLRRPRDVVPRLRSEPALLIVPNSERKPRLDRLLAEDPIELEHLETVRGRVLWRLREREIWLVRVQEPAQPAEAAVAPRGSTLSGPGPARMKSD